MSDDLKKELEKLKIVQGPDGRIVFETKEKEEK
jgi:hypothetical protein